LLRQLEVQLHELGAVAGIDLHLEVVGDDAAEVEAERSVGPLEERLVAEAARGERLADRGLLVFEARLDLDLARLPVVADELLLHGPQDERRHARLRLPALEDQLRLALLLVVDDAVSVVALLVGTHHDLLAALLAPERLAELRLELRGPLREVGDR